MPRRPLGPITPNIIRRKELTPYTRGFILRQLTAGVEQADVAKALNLSRATVRTTLLRADTRINGESVERSGRPKVTDDRDERIILRLARINPKQTYQELIQRSGVKCSKSTIYRILARAGIINWLAKKRPLLRQQDVDAKLHWAKIYENWTYEDWAKVI